MRRTGQDPAANALNVIAPYLSGNTVPGPSSPSGLVINMVTDASDDPEFQSGGGLVAIHGSIAADVVNLSGRVPVIGRRRRVFPPLSVSNQLALDASQLEGTLERRRRPAQRFFARPRTATTGWQFTDTACRP